MTFLRLTNIIRDVRVSYLYQLNKGRRKGSKMEKCPDGRHKWGEWRERKNPAGGTTFRIRRCTICPAKETRKKNGKK
ncbi:MAG: hypothetical protein AAB451_03280 [Patescibacteria group bacterium]